MDLTRLPFAAFGGQSLAVFQTLSRELYKKVDDERIVSYDEDLFQLIKERGDLIRKLRHITALRMCKLLVAKSGILRRKRDKNLLIYPDTQFSEIGAHINNATYYATIPYEIILPKTLCISYNHKSFKRLHNHLCFITRNIIKKSFGNVHITDISFEVPFNFLEINFRNNTVRYFQLILRQCCSSHLPETLEIPYMSNFILQNFLERFINFI